METATETIFASTSTTATASSDFGTRLASIDDLISIKAEKTRNGIKPRLYFKYIKSKFTPLETKKLNSGIKKIEKAFDKAVANGQIALGKKLLNKVGIATKELLMQTRGIKYYIEKEYLNKHKHNIRDGNISDTKLEKYTRLIPEDVIKKLDKVRDVFDDFVIYHYWNDDVEDVKEMSEEEKEDMKDPVLFGTIKENDKLYFIADWEDEYCDLTFEEMIDELGVEKEKLLVEKIINK